MKTKPVLLQSILLLAVFLTLPAVVQAQDYTYMTNGDNTITITGYTGSGGAVTIPDTINSLPVTSIGNWAFCGCGSLTNVTIGNSVIRIGEGAFAACGLTSIVIPNSVTSIDYGAFSDCASLVSITLPNSITSIEDAAFYNCTSLTNVTIPDSINSIGYEAFDGCTSLRSVVIGNSVTSIGFDAFAYCTSLSSVTISNSVTNIMAGAFQNCTSLTNITIPDSVTSIGDEAFDGCTSLTSITVDTNNPVYSSMDGILFNKSQTTLILYPRGDAGSYTIPNSVTSIGNWAFAYFSSLTNVTIPDSVTNIGDSAFYWCNSLTSVTIPNSVTSIGGWAFYRCGSLTNVTIGNSVTSIGNWAFGNCATLTGVYFLGNAPNVGSSVFYGDNHATVYYLPGTTGWGPTFVGVPTALWIPFTYMTNNGTLILTGTTGLISAVLTIPGAIYGLPVTSIGDNAFSNCTSLTSVTIPNSVTNIGDYAFYNCYRLTNVYFKGNVPSVGSDVFDFDRNATVYYLPGTTGWSSTFGGRPTALWFLPNPLILINGSSFGVKTNGFGFIISWATNASVAVEACTNLANPVWQPIQTNTLTSGFVYFSDSAWTNYPNRFYRLR